MSSKVAHLAYQKLNNILSFQTEKRSIEIQGERHKKDLKEANDRISNLCHELQDACKDSSNLKFVFFVFVNFYRRSSNDSDEP